MIDRSATGVTVVASVAESFELAGSKVSEETVAVFDTEPSTVGITTMVTACTSPECMVPRSHSTVVRTSEQLPTDGTADTNVIPTGSGSEATTFSASDGPFDDTVSV